MSTDGWVAMKPAYCCIKRAKDDWDEAENGKLISGLSTAGSFTGFSEPSFAPP